MNMAIDEAILMARCLGKVPNTVRFYRWQPSAVSLGRFRPVEQDVNVEACKKLGVDIVRRPTGGGTVYHDAKGEITYSVVVKASDIGSPDVETSYAILCSGLIEACRILGDIMLSGKGAEKDSDVMYTTTMALNHSYRMPRKNFSWITSGTIYNGYYQDEHDLDINFLGLSSGLAWQGKKMIWKNQMLASHLELGYDRYLNEYGLESGLTLYPTPAVILALNGRIARRDYLQNSDKDSLNTRFDLLTSISSGNHRISLNLGLEYENSDERMYQYDRFVLGMRYDYIFSRRLSGFFSLRNQDSQYQGKEAMFAEKRHDDITYCSLGLARALWVDPAGGRSLSLEISHTYTDADSNIDLYQYRKNVTLSTLTFLF